MVAILVWLFCCTLFEIICAGQAQSHLSTKLGASGSIVFHQEWDLLGPFRIGTREAVWKADPLEVTGGFKNISYDQHSRFRSSLAPNATVKWSRQVLDVHGSGDKSSVHFEIIHDQVDWAFQQEVYGWPALQFQTWARGVLNNPGAERLRAWVYPQGILELYINDDHFFGGDFFTFNRAPILVDLEPGSNIFDVRLIRDVRAMGGTKPPFIDAKIRVELAEITPEIDYSQTMIPNIVDGRLPSRHLSLPIRNPLLSWITLTDCEQTNFTFLEPLATLRIAPGQIRPIALKISDTWPVATAFKGVICYDVDDEQEQTHSQHLPFTIPLEHAGLSDASKFTFLHKSGTVSYAILKPPTVYTKGETLPLLVVLHGAGVEADGDQVKHSFDGMPDLETFGLFPTGMSMWSGDDWHVWGSADVLSAIDAVHDWMREMKWNGTRITTQQVIVAGHSNGGQGTWFFATHYPDRTLAAAIASGYTSIENYVPFTMWGEVEPSQDAVLNNARGSYRHELLLENLADIMVMQQHGSADDNVPPYHSRLMSSLRLDAGLSSDYIEFPGKPHYWEGALTTKPMQQFYRDSLKLGNCELSPVTNHFTIVYPGCGHIESKFGIVVDQLKTPDRFSRIRGRVVEDDSHFYWRLQTTNIHRLHLDFETLPSERPSYIILDSDPTPRIWQDMAFSKSCVKRDDREWHCSDAEWKSIGQRHGMQRGAMDAILRTKGTFQIVSCLEEIDLAVQLSRNLLQYYGADATILPCEQYELALGRSGNMIMLANSTGVPQSRLNEYPITVSRDAVSLRVSFSRELLTIALEPGIGAAFLRPLSDERLELVIWGADAIGLKHAARFVPTITGAGQPDFVVFGPEIRHKGHKGALAMGFFDHNWNISHASYLP